MAGIKVPQYDIFKIGTDKLKYSKWDLTITRTEAFNAQEIVSLFEAQEFRLIAQILDQEISTIDFSKYILIVVIDKKSDFNRAVDHQGIKVNGNTFRRFVGTSGGLKKNTLLFVNTEVLDELNKRCECGRGEIKIVPAKYEAYKALTCSASQPICDPEHILVVSDCLIMIKDNIIKIDDSSDAVEPEMTYLEDQDIENNASDGFNLCTIEYMERVAESLELDYVPDGVCLRNAWLKGMLYPFPIKEFAKEFNDGKYIVDDIWGNPHDLRKVDMILTESSLKLWKAYASIEDYQKKYKENGYCFAVTKIASHQLEDQRELNYQYLQSYDFTDEDIKELCEPTVKYLKDALCGDYESTKRFLGIKNDVEKNTWQHSLYVNEYMMGDPYVIESTHKMIRKKIDQAKIGKLLVNGNYQLLSGDPFALMQHICGLSVTGLLKANEVYSKYWIDRDVDEICIFRSPMTAHNNIRKCKINNSEVCQKWYRYMKTILIFNGFDGLCMSLNGADYDGDLGFSTNNSILMKRHRVTPPISCIQRNVDKVIPTEADILKSDLGGMGNKVGSITNRVTAMMEVQSHFEKGTKEYEDLAYRIACGQLYQQAEIDKIKGIVSDPMPNYWYNYYGCKGDKYLQSICADKKPYFMIYVYSDYKVEYNKYQKECNKSCLLEFGITLDELLAMPEHKEDQKKFLSYYEHKQPFGMGNCAMNRICHYIEDEFKGIVSSRKRESNFDYKRIKYSSAVSKDIKSAVQELHDEYVTYVRETKKKQKNVDKDDRFMNRQMMKKYFKSEIVKACPDERQRFNAVLELTYKHNGNKQFFWDCVGDLMIKRLEELR